VVLARDPGTEGLLGIAWTHMVAVKSVDDPLLAQFLSFWIGKGAPSRALPAS
jgi:hypothetical protein